MVKQLKIRPMAMNKQKLELTWIGKENRPRLEPRILLEDPELSYHASHRVTDDDIFDNRLIFGDNLLALKALEQEFAGKVKCVFIDPPYNTGSAFEHYDDGLEHSIWLSMMRDRLEIIRGLLSEQGSSGSRSTTTSCTTSKFSWMRYLAVQISSQPLSGRKSTQPRTPPGTSLQCMITWSFTLGTKTSGLSTNFRERKNRIRLIPTRMMIRGDHGKPHLCMPGTTTASVST